MGRPSPTFLDEARTLNAPNFQPRVVVGIVTRDRASVLRKALQSAFAQDYPNLEVRVVNDGSKDETGELSSEYPTIKWTNSQESRGYISGRNYLMSEANADYYVSLDDDSWFVVGDEIRVAVAFLESHPDVAAVGFDILSPDKATVRERSEPRDIAMFIGCGHVVRLAATLLHGNYVPAPGEYGGEEKDLALRLMDAGYRVMSLPGVHVWHDKTTLAREQPAQHRSGVCNDLAMTLRRTPLFVLPIALLAKLYRHHRFARTHQLGRPFREGVRLFLRSIPRLWGTRRAVRLATLRRYVRLSHQ
jgi:glycosyltransferase involved in cell wall biosynthesis